MTITTIKCDGCGREKGDANHWQRILVRPTVDVDKPPMIVVGSILGWNQDHDEFHDLCGESCFHRHLAKLLKIPAPEPMAVAPSEPPSFQGLKDAIDDDTPF